jgi:hypothetical protein
MAESLKIPIAATNLSAITHHVGRVVNTRTDIVYDPKITSGPAAIKIEARRPSRLPTDAPLWTLPNAQTHFDVLYARVQLWVHVDYKKYRETWLDMMWHVQRTTYLDHVQNRRSTRLRNSVYPYIRLVPVPQQINTNAGHGTGGEGMEFAHTKDLQGSMSADAWNQRMREYQLEAHARGVIYADPFDLTKMLSISPGTKNLAGVAVTQHNFYKPLPVSRPVIRRARR